MKRYFLLLSAIIFPLFLAFAYYFFFSTDGGQTYAGGECWIYAFTGLDCPGCGGQRAVYHLLHGNPLAALRFNLIFVLGMPMGIIYYYYFVRVYALKQEKYLDSFVFKPIFAWILLASVIIFTILRNIPIFPLTYLNSHF